MPFLF